MAGATSRVSRVLMAGPLAPFAEAYRRELRERGDTERAALLWGFAEAYEERLNFTLRRRELYADRLDEPAAASRDRYDAGRRLDVGEAVEAALSLD